MRRTGIFLLVAALVVAMTGCTAVGGGGYAESHTLTITSTTGGSVAYPGEGSFTCTDGKVISLFAQAEDGYHFVNWTGDVDTVASVNFALTTVTTDDSYSIRANFAEGSSPTGINYTEGEVEQLIIVLVNNERQSNNLSALTEEPLLTSLAKEHSVSMVEHHFFSHDRWPGERELSYNMSPGTTRGENIAKIPSREVIPGPFLTLEQVCEWAVSGWMNSTGHKENILRPCFTKTGVGVEFSEEGAFIYLYITQNFEGVS